MRGVADATDARVRWERAGTTFRARPRQMGPAEIRLDQEPKSRRARPAPGRQKSSGLSVFCELMASTLAGSTVTGAAAQDRRSPRPRRPGRGSTACRPLRRCAGCRSRQALGGGRIVSTCRRRRIGEFRHRRRQIPCFPLTKLISISAPNRALCMKTSKASLPVAQTARIPLAEPAHVLHGGLRRSVDLALLLLVRRQQKNEDDEPKDGSKRNISVPLSESQLAGGPASSLPMSGGTITSRQ